MLRGFLGLSLGLSLTLFGANPSSTNYTLKAFDFGNGGGSSSSTSFKLNAITSGQTGDSLSSSSYKMGPGFTSTVNTNVPPAPAFTNPNNNYDRLKLTLDTGGNPSNTKYAIAISSDDFVTTLYVQPDNTVGSAFSLSNYQTYAAWGGGTGFFVLGLQSNTSYKVKIKAFNGNFSGSAYGPIATAATVLPSITFSVATSQTSTPPFNVSFNSLSPGNSVYSTDYDPVLSLTTNALFGGSVYVKGSNSGLRSTSANYTINSATANLDSSASGYGAQVTSAGQTSGGPISAVSPFDGSSNNVGSIPTVLQPILSTPGSVNSANATVKIKAKTNIVIPSSNDYGDVLTFIASMIF